MTRENFDLHSPVSILRNGYSPELPRPELYMDVGGQDSYGFWEGFGIFRELLDRNQIQYTAEFFPQGTHDISVQPERRANVIRFVRDRLLSH